MIDRDKQKSRDTGSVSSLCPHAGAALHAPDPWDCSYIKKTQITARRCITPRHSLSTFISNLSCAENLSQPGYMRALISNSKGAAAVRQHERYTDSGWHKSQKAHLAVGESPAAAAVAVKCQKTWHMPAPLERPGGCPSLTGPLPGQALSTPLTPLAVSGPVAILNHLRTRCQGFFVLYV